MLPLISFETGRKTQTQSSGQPDELRQQMEVWFYPRIETAAERPTPRAEKGKGFLHRRSSRAHQEAFCLLTRTYHRSRLTGQVPYQDFTFPITAFYKGESQEKRLPGDWKEQRFLPGSPAQVMLGGSWGFLFSQSHVVVVTTLRFLMRQAVRLEKLPTMVLSEAQGL